MASIAPRPFGLSILSWSQRCAHSRLLLRRSLKRSHVDGVNRAQSAAMSGLRCCLPCTHPSSHFETSTYVDRPRRTSQTCTSTVYLADMYTSHYTLHLYRFRQNLMEDLLSLLPAGTVRDELRRDLESMPNG
eukprot:6178059-Pleurochrysis_carterae.AAC.1